MGGGQNTSNMETYIWIHFIVTIYIRQTTITYLIVLFFSIDSSTITSGIEKCKTDITKIEFDCFSIHTSSIERSYLLEEKEDETSELDTYQPVQSLNNDHGVSFFPISAPHNNINHHTLQVAQQVSHFYYFKI